MQFTFTLSYRLPSVDCDPDQLIERLAEEGCDDALVGVGQPGRMALEFDREASSAREAIESALNDVSRAVPDAELIEASPDLVGLSEIAQVMNMTRQGMRKMMLGIGGFPSPVHEGSASIWHLAEVLTHIQDYGVRAVPQSTLEIAIVAMQVNISKELRRLEVMNHVVDSTSFDEVISRIYAPTRDKHRL